MPNIDSVNQLINEYHSKHPDGHFFDRDTLKFFGETVSSMRLSKNTVQVKDISGDEHEAYALSRLQRNYPGGARRTYAYFDIETLDDIMMP